MTLAEIETELRKALDKARAEGQEIARGDYRTCAIGHYCRLKHISYGPIKLAKHWRVDRWWIGDLLIGFDGNTPAFDFHEDAFALGRKLAAEYVSK